MLDNPEKTTKLLAALKAAVPFEVELTEQVVKQLRMDEKTTPCPSYHTLATKVASCAISFRRKNEKHSLSP